MKIVGVTGDVTRYNGAFIVVVSSDEMKKIIGEPGLANEKLPNVGQEIQIGKAWELVRYVRERKATIEALRAQIAGILKRTEDAMETVTEPLVIESTSS